MFVPMIVALAAVAAASPAPAKPHPHITMSQARTIALKLAPGRVQDAEYEKEAGAWRYSFDIRQGQRIHEVGVDAMTGRVVENSFEDPSKPD